MDVQYALNLEPIAHDLSRRTLERYQVLFIENNLAAGVMNDVTTALVEALGLKVDLQRLDSTHILSDMASFGRTRLMGVAIKRFLTQLKRYDPEAYEALEEELRRRYEPSTQKLFGEWGKDADSRHRLRSQVAADMHNLIKQFGTDEKHCERSTYRAMERIFEVQMITSALPQTAVESDTTAFPEVLDDLNIFPDIYLCIWRHNASEKSRKPIKKRRSALRGGKISQPYT